MDGSFYLRKDLSQYGAASNLQFNEHIKHLQSIGEKIYHLGFGQSPFPVPDFAQEALKKYAHVGQYLPIRGLPELREAICEMHRKEDDVNHFQPCNVLVGPGSKELIFLLDNIIDGDVLLLAPTWTTYMPQALLSRKTVHKIPTSFEEKWKLTPSSLDKVFSESTIKENSVLILCSPDNPTGTSYSKIELQELSEKFRQYKLIVVSDEIYSRLSFKQNHVSLAKYYPEGTILSCGISKWASCGGWRLGYHMFPNQLQAVGNAVSSAASQTYTSASAPIQYASIELLKYDDRSKEFVFHCSRVLGAVAEYCCKTLQKSGVKVVTPSSGYYVFPDFEVIREALAARGITTGPGMCKALLKDTGVVVMAGGPAYLHSESDLTVRLCYVNFDGNYALAGSRSFGVDNVLPGSFVHDYCAPTVEAINLIVDWVQKTKTNSFNK